MGDSRDNKDSSGKALCYFILLAIVVVIVVIVVLALTVFRVRDPQVTVDSYQVRSFALSFPNSNPTLSFIIDATIAVKNQNHASFKYQGSTAFVFYHGIAISEASIPPGEVGSDTTTRIATEVTVTSSSFVGNPFIAGDISAGAIPLTATITLPGRINVAGIVKKHATAVSTCTFNLLVATQSLGNFNCNTKLNFSG